MHGFADLDEIGKVALALCIAESCFTALERDVEVAALGREALDAAWSVVGSIIAYERARRRDFSSIISEIDDHGLGDLWRFALQTGRLDQRTVEAQHRNLRERS